MYHETTYLEQRIRRRKLLLLAVACVVVAVCIWQCLRMSQALAREQAARSVRESVLRAAVQCCAIEGSYPTSLAHLEQHYGLTVNERDYRITYEWLGDNIAPSVVVMPR